MQRTLSLLLPARPEQRRARLITAVTVVVGAATIAATSSGTGEVAAVDGASGPSSAEVVRAAPPGPDSAFTPATERASAFTPAAERESALTPATERATTTSLSSPNDTSAVAIERLSQQQRLPSLDADEVETDDTTPTINDVEVDAQQAEEPLAYTAADGQVVTPERIFAFLDGRNAPLADQAETFVAAGIAHDVDPRVVVAIAIAESDAGKMHPEGTYNAWGWGGSGGPRGLRAWDSWEQSIHQYTERLGALYDTDNVDWEFASTYCPPNTQWWIDTVTWAIGQI
ncbi:MAG: hypothetical protein R6V28_00785 [Nitriliruptoraceae bacterium]